MKTARERTGAFSLVEITLALGVAAFALLAIFGLLATGSQINHTASEQTAAVDILTSVANDLRATPTSSSSSPQFGISIPADSSGGSTGSPLYFDSAGQSSTSLGNGSRYRLVATFLPNGGGRTATLADLRLTWPAAADPANANTGAAEIFVALDRN